MRLADQWARAAVLAILAMMCGCGPTETRVSVGNRDQILHLSNLTHVEDIDPQIVTGVPEQHVLSALFEGLVAEDPVDLHPVPGTALSWDLSEDGTVYTFHLRTNATWTNGERVTALDFVRSYQRMLTPELGGPYAYMLYVMKNAEPYQTGRLTDFDQVGVKALDEATLRITLEAPTPYFLSLINHYTWFPVPVSVIEQHGPATSRGNRWTRPGHFVGNGPFRLKDWRTGYVVVVEKNPDYWNAAQVKLKEIRFYGMESLETEDRAFRANQLHRTYELLSSKIAAYRKERPEMLRVEPYLGTYFYRFNTTIEPTKDKRVRQALVKSIDRQSIVDNVMRGGQLPGYALTPPNTAGYTPRARVEENVEEARRLLAEAGYAHGEGFPKIEILYNTEENHRAIAEAIQEMWRRNLNIEVTLVNQEWKVYLAAQRQTNYYVCRAGWIGDYVDPNTFLDLWTSWSQQNQTGWANARYDELIRKAGVTQDSAARNELFQQAEALLLEELPIMPIYIYTRVYALQTSVQGWHPTLLDHHPYTHLHLEE